MTDLTKKRFKYYEQTENGSRNRQTKAQINLQMKKCYGLDEVELIPEIIKTFDKTYKS